MMKEEYDIGQDDDEALKALSKEKAQEYLLKIRVFTESVVTKCSQVDPQSGQRKISTGDRRFEIMLSREKDKFYLETGFQPE